MAAPLEVLGETGEGPGEPGEGGFEGRREGGAGERGEACAQAREQALGARTVGRPVPFRAARERLGLVLVGAGLLGPGEERGVGHQALAGGGAGALVVGEPAPELAGRERGLPQGREQGLGVGGVGARQRGQHPHRGPGGEGAGPHRGEQRLG